MTTLRFTVPGCPVPKARARAGSGHHFTPTTTRDYERKVRATALAARGRLGAPPTGPMSFVVALYMPDRRRRDLDNCVKALTDALNGVAYRDDSQIVDLHATKHFGSEHPCAVVTVMEL